MKGIITPEESALTWSDLFILQDLATVLKEVRHRLQTPRRCPHLNLHLPAPAEHQLLAAKAVSVGLEIPLYRINSELLNEYIAKSDNSMQQLFTPVGQQQSILFFDEADALFARSTNGNSANADGAGRQVGYLLKTIHQQPWITIMACRRRLEWHEGNANPPGYDISIAA